MEQQDRSQYLRALGLTGWRLRADGPLAGRARAESVGECTPARAPEHEPESAADAESLPGTSAEAAAVLSAPVQAVPEDARARNSGPASAGTPYRSGEPKTELSRETVSSSCADMDWGALEAYLATCDHRGAKRPVFGTGARDAAVLIVGEAPGAQEDEQGVPFVGRAGKLLDRMLFAIGCSRDTNVYITNICKFRPPANRDPRPDEVAADWPILERQIELLNPKLVVTVGRVAAQTLLDSRESLARLRGHRHRYPRRPLDVLVTYHPAYLLRSPGQKRKAWDDLKAIAQVVSEKAT